MATRVYWSPKIATTVLTLSAAPPEYAALTLRELPLADLRHDSAGTHAMLGSPGADRQLFLTAGVTDTTGLALLIPLDSDFPEHLAAAAAFWRSLSDSGPPAPDMLSPQRRARLLDALRALDARLDGASVRQIASALFGASRVPTGTEWKSHDLRNRTKRLIELGERLMRGGYRELLRHTVRQR